jgi:hypothetical protein
LRTILDQRVGILLDSPCVDRYQNNRENNADSQKFRGDLKGSHDQLLTNQPARGYAISTFVRRSKIMPLKEP